MSKPKYSLIVNWDSPDGLPSSPPPTDTSGEPDYEAGDREYDPDDDFEDEFEYEEN